MTALELLGVLTVFCSAYLLLGRGGFWREAPMAPAPALTHWPEIVAVIPARDEADTIERTVASLLGQDYPGRILVIVVDDESGDGTADAARRADTKDGRLTILAGRPLPPGWTGKMWAVAEGLEEAATWCPSATHVLLTDADIEHHPANLAELAARAVGEDRDLVSLMVKLNCETPAERMLVPAFVFFFQMLYPFAWSRRRDCRTAGAAGGCMLVRMDALRRAGGIEAIRSRLIDDCALARQLKAQGSIWVGLTAATRSLRRYRHFRDIWMVVARTAYSQLRHSPALLAGTVIGMLVVFVAPPALALAGSGWAAWLGLAAWAGLALAYAPTLRFYGRSILWAPLLPLVALFYTGATIDSARRHGQGRGGAWKGRVHGREPA